jgi:hypothetical protein
VTGRMTASLSIARLYAASPGSFYVWVVSKKSVWQFK